MGEHGIRSSTIIVVGCPFLKHNTSYTPRLLYFSVVNSLRMSCGCSVIAARAAKYQQSPNAPWLISHGTIESEKTRTSPLQNSSGRFQITLGWSLLDGSLNSAVSSGKNSASTNLRSRGCKAILASRAAACCKFAAGHDLHVFLLSSKC